VNDCCALTDSPIADTAPDVAIIGAGSAGFAAAIRASELGARAVLIGHGTIGGTCVNIGCIPSKTLIRAVETLHQARVASRFAGIHARAELVDWKSAVAQKDELVDEMRRSKYINLLAEYENLTYLEGQAHLVPEGINVNGTVLTPGKIVIATGAAPAVPAIPGLKAIPFLTSTTALDLQELPASLLVIGGGVIGCELSQLFARAGVHVTIVCRSRLLPHAEPEISEALEVYLRDEGLDIRCGVRYRAIRDEGGSVTLDLDDLDGASESVTAQRVLVATGRRPNTQGLGLDAAGIALTSRGGIEVDEHLRTTRAGIYAAGDVTGRDMFVYMAAYGAKIAAENALLGDRRSYDATAMPEVVFTDPQVAMVGITESQARERGLEPESVILQLDRVPRAQAARDTRGLIKLVAERESGRLLGAHVLAPEAGECIQTAVLAVKGGLTVYDLAETLFPYLTTVEGLKLAALGFTKDIAKLSCCAG
jgi:mercuric reductase